MGQDYWSNQARDFYDNESRQKQDWRYYRTFAQAYKKLADIVTLSPSHSLLDIGCGCGELGQALREQIGFYCGIDISWDSLAIARERNTDGRFVCADMTALPLSVTFDTAVAMTSLEFVYDKAAALNEVRRMLKDSGRLYVEVRNADFLLFKILAPVMEHLARWGLVVPYEAEGFRDLGFVEWTELLTKTGFRIIGLRKSLRPAMYGGVMTRLKNLLIKLVAWLAPIRQHYMVGFLCTRQ